MQPKTKTFISRNILSTIIISLVSIGSLAQTPYHKPTLVIGIVVEGLNDDYISHLQECFVDGGFKRLTKDGVSIGNVDFGPGLDPVAATAIIYTGASPNVTGIPAATIYDATLRKGRHSLLDPQEIGNFTNETYSPKSIAVSTISDEIRLDAQGIGSVHSLSSDSHKSIIMAGHAANSAFWINDTNGQWATTTYYKDVPTPIAGRNYNAPIAERLDTMTWAPLLPIDLYPDIPEYRRKFTFRYTFPKKEVDRYLQYKATPLANTEITDMACDYITTMSLGRHGAIDMLNIAYTVTSYAYANESDTRMETMDAYVRLDRDLARLFNTIDRNVGAENALIFLAATPPPMTGKRDDEKWGVPSGQFSPKRAVSLLNMYLMALHGNGEWVSGYHEGHFFLNAKTIKEKSLDVASVRAEAADFLGRMSGISNVFTIDDIISNRAGENASALKRNTSIKHSGDVIISVTPGWEITNDDTRTNNTVVREGYVPTPFFVMWPGVKPQRIETPVDARTIAPTISRLLRIRSPNAASAPALRL